ncbi:hypothetical protein FPE01S_01_07920 [Flavihumibacter petaseus NBRC 106054]|uniref:Uncharacterized protein n=2 Tax=Flavihumibacter TaxID=1004301 RepID=A0A0E9MW90_9BACT|nr:hypothetical protein FPE01S_01_07920 [Flavihumibacter petaseus NBRC 106054]
MIGSLISCKSKSKDKQWDNAGIDPTIIQNNSFGLLNQEDEVFSVLEKQNTVAKRTSGVLYFTKGHIDLSDSNSARLNNCGAYFFHGDTLSINIGIGNGFGGWGFIINYEDKRFNTEPYFETDLVIDGEAEPVYEIVYQKLALDKSFYKPGDSLFGKIDFRAIEIGQDSEKIEHSGNGYFRTRVATQ